MSRIEPVWEAWPVTHRLVRNDKSPTPGDPLGSIEVQMVCDADWQVRRPSSDRARVRVEAVAS